MSVFVDTSIWYAAADTGDRSNAIAKLILSNQQPLITSDHVLVETWLLLRHRLSRNAAENFWDKLRAGVASIEIVTTADLEAAWAINQAFPDQDFSIVDRTSFALMQRLGLQRVASLDVDFAVFRYGRNRDRAFELVR